MFRCQFNPNIQELVAAAETLGKNGRHAANAETAIQICLADVGICNLPIVLIDKTIQGILNWLHQVVVINSYRNAIMIIR